MTLALLPTNAMALLYGGQIWPPQPPLVGLWCAHCGYALIAGWCSRCDLDAQGEHDACRR